MDSHSTESYFKNEHDSCEEGEISDESPIDPPLEGYIPIIGSSKQQDEPEYEEEYEDNDDDDAPEEILNRIAQQKALIPKEVIDPLFCHLCKKNPHKYRCPKCNVRSCSLECSKKHKEADECDGVRPPYNPVAKLSEFDASTSVKDQNWMANIQDKVYDESKTFTSRTRHPGIQQEEHQTDIEQNHGEVVIHNDQPQQPSQRQFPQFINADGTRNSANNSVEHFLLPNAHRRRIFLSFSDDKEDDNSRHEQFSDSIFWCLEFIFRKQADDGTISDYIYKVQNIPETIRICTVIKQFLKPRKYGCVVSESDLNLDKMKPFIDVGMESLIMLMRVPRFEKERYYVVNPEKSVLDNTRNRVIVNHPKIIVTLGNECVNMITISEDEAEDLRSRLQKERSSQQRTQVHQGGPRGGRGGFRGGRGRGRGGSGGFRGGSGPPSYANYKRSNDGIPGGDWKRGRGTGTGGRWGPPRGGAPRFSQPEAFDPFEPFKGSNTLPPDYGMKVGNNSMLSWEHINRGSIDSPASPQHESPCEYHATDVSTFNR